VPGQLDGHGRALLVGPPRSSTSNPSHSSGLHPILQFCCHIKFPVQAQADMAELYICVSAVCPLVACHVQPLSPRSQSCGGSIR
jgi:hypothetical protein